MNADTKATAMYGYRMVQLVGEIFTNVGYHVEQEPAITKNEPRYHFDLIARNGNHNLAIEIKAFRSKMVPSGIVLDAITQLLSLIELSREEYIPVVVIVGYGSQILYNEITNRFQSKVLVLDIRHLLFMVQNNQELRDRLVSALEYSVANVVPVIPDVNINFQSIRPQLPELSEYDSLIKQLDSWDSASTTSAAYERLCTDVLKRVFADDLALWKEQQTSDAGLFRFDLICKIKNGNVKEFWNMCERYFNSKYIVFEYKNYRECITQKEIFTTVKYLYMKALRGVAIIVSVNGTDENADWAIRGILREEGKLIISLSNADLRNMLELKKQNQDPSEYLGEKLDALLIDLEK